MDSKDRKLLNLVQEGLPLAEKPYQKLGEKIGLSAQEVINRLKSLYQKGYIRRLGGVFDSNKLGYSSLLVAVETESDKFQQVADYISNFCGVTHCYKRNSFLDLWFTLTTERQEKREEILRKIRNQPGVKSLYQLPRKKSFKLKVYFDMEENK